MSDAQRKAKARARTSLFPDRVAAERAENTGRKAALRAADREQAAEILAAQSGTESEPDCDRYASAVIYATRRSSTVGSVDSN
jgi:hypothetical protein